MSRRYSRDDSDVRVTHRSWYYACALVFIIIASVVLAVSFLTDNWLEYDVDRRALEALEPRAYAPYTQDQFTRLWRDDFKFYTRNRGLFRTCFEVEDGFLFLDARPVDIDGNCLRQTAYDFEDSNIRATDAEDENWTLRRNLMRTHLAMFILAIVCLALAIVISVLGCWCLSVKAFVVVCIFCFISCIAILVGMVFFHWYKYIEENELDFDEYDRKAWHQEPFLVDHTDVRYAYSYVLGWVALFFAILAFVFFVLAAWATRREKYGFVEPGKSEVLVVDHYPNKPVSPPPTVVVPTPQPIYAPAPQPIYAPAPPQPIYGGPVVVAPQAIYG